VSKLAHLHLHRERRAAGLRIYKLCLNTVDLENMLESAGLLHPGITEDHSAVEAALTRLVQRLIDQEAETSFDQ
jgi:hypothetical protein